MLPQDTSVQSRSTPCQGDAVLVYALVVHLAESIRVEPVLAPSLGWAGVGLTTLGVWVLMLSKAQRNPKIAHEVKADECTSASK